MVAPRHINTAKHYHHLQMLLHSTSQEAQALCAYGSKRFHDSLLHVLEEARTQSAHLEEGLHAHAREVIDYFGNQRIAKTERMDAIQQHTQSGGSWKKFWRGVKHAVKKVGHFVAYKVFSEKNLKGVGDFINERVLTKENIANTLKIGAAVATKV